MIISLEQYKAIAGITDNSQDSRITALIDVVENDYLAIRGKAFDEDGEGNTVYPEGSLGTAAEMISYKLLTSKGEIGVTSETIGDYSVGLSADLLKGYPRSTVQRIRRFARAK
ncbi:MAG: hypothetical protein II903_09430 [Spirochaetales bacterium]|nr:hypothetical protein [Spirochaetales bacterium]